MSTGESKRYKHMGQVQLSGALLASPEQPWVPPPAQKRKKQVRAREGEEKGEEDRTQQLSQNVYLSQYEFY